MQIGSGLNPDLAMPRGGVFRGGGGGGADYFSLLGKRRKVPQETMAQGEPGHMAFPKIKIVQINFMTNLE